MLLRLVYVRYVLASGAALAIDMSVFLGALALGTPSVAAAALGYATGLIAHWLISSRAVFAESLADKGAQRSQQQALFAGSAAVGLAITTAIVGGSDLVGVDPRLAKILAIAISFQVTYLLRRKIVFAQ